MIDRTLRTLFLAALAALALLVPMAGPARAEQEKPAASNDGSEGSQSDLFIDTVEVNVVNVDVYVTDHDGNPVKGLTAKDFEVLENGNEVSLTNFYAIEGSQVVESEGSGPTLPQGAVAGEEHTAEPKEQIPGLAPKPTIPEDQRLSLVLYVDNYNIRPHNRRRVLQDVRSFVSRHVGPQDRVMLVTYDHALHVRRSFTSDTRSVVDALFKVDELTGNAVHFDSDRRDTLRRIEDSQSAGEALSWAETYAESIRNDLFFSIDAMREIVNSLAGLPGRKAILYVSDGVPMIAGEDIFHAVQQKYSSSGAMTRVLDYDASRRFEELAATANANRVSFYTLDAAGLRPPSSADASEFGRGQAGSLQFVDSVRTHNLQAPLQMLAEETGGRAIINLNRVGPILDKVAQDFRSYYSLGYSPAHSGDGRYYKIDVKLKGAAAGHKYSLRHRTGYRDKTSADQMSDGVLAALHFPYYANPLDLDLSFDTSHQRDDGLFLVPVKVRVPLRSLTLVPRGNTYQAQAKLYLAALDDRGDVSDVQHVLLPVQVSADEIGQLDGKDFIYTVSLLMRRGEQKVAVGVRDEIAANNSFVTATVHVN